MKIRMIRGALLLLFVLLGLDAAADTRSGELLGRMSDKLKSYPAYEVGYVALFDAEHSLQGIYLVKGSRYYIKAGDAEVFSDGKTRWEVNSENREVTVDDINPTDRTILGNPTGALDFLDGDYTHSHLGQRRVDDRVCDLVQLKPLRANESLSGITLAMDARTGLPVEIIYNIAGGQKLEITIKYILTDISPDDSRFVFSKERYRGFEIIDFR